jgi:ubiquinone/menaquinone biosynthesis C-methylase UbiE
LEAIENITTWYDNWHEVHGADAWRPMRAYRPLLKHLGNPTDGRLLDVGCGVGQFLRVASDAGLETTGIDISSKGINIARSESRYSKLVVGDMGSLPFGDESFDYITAFGSLEHAQSIQSALSEMLRVGTPDAKYAVLVPNRTFVGHLFGVNGSIQEISETQFCLDCWREMFCRAGFRINRVVQDRWRWLPVPLRWVYCFVFEMEKHV